MSTRRGTTRARATAVVTASVLLLAACSVAPSPTPYPTQVPVAPPGRAAIVARQFVAAWAASDYGAMWNLVAPADQAVVGRDRFVHLYEQLASLMKLTRLTATYEPATPTALPPEPVAPDLLASPSPSASEAGGSPSTPATPTGASASASPGATPGASATPLSTPGPILPGPVPGMAVDAHLTLATDLFGSVTLDRSIVLVRGASDWQVHWTPASLFPGLGDDGSLELTRQVSPRGRIVTQDGTVFAETRADGMRVYPQEYLAGQLIGYVGKVTAKDMKTLAARGYELGDWVGRSGLEAGAEDLLRGTPGFTLSVVRSGHDPVAVLQSPMVPGADVTITLRPDLQRAAEAAMARYPRVGAAAIDPKSGDIWVLASLPRFDPNAMTLGTTLSGRPLAKPSSEQIVDKAVLGAYPAGSDFKPFTLGAALQTGTVTTTDTMLCPSTWTFEGFTFKNWRYETLPGQRTWVDTMALSCNTTYMPLSVRLYDRNKTALTDLLHTFGFGEATGVPFLAENPGRLPDAAYYATHKRWNGTTSPYGPFDQIQLAIGQGEFLGTPLQLATAYAAWGNRGTLWYPRIVLKATLPDGTVVYDSRPTVHHVIPLDRSVMDYVVTTMRAVVTSPLGTAYRSFLGFPYAVAGKSGTAETGGPDPDAWFPSFAPANDPTIAVAVVVVTVPLGNGGDFAAPIVRQIMQRHFAP